MPLAIRTSTILALLEDQRKKFEQDDYSPHPRLIRRCRSYCQLLKNDASCLATKPRQTRERLSNTRHNLEAILARSAEVFILRCLSQTASTIGLTREYGTVPKFMAWWASVVHPQPLKDMAQDMCKEFGLRYTTSQDTAQPDRSVNKPTAAEGQTSQDQSGTFLYNPIRDITTDLPRGPQPKEVFHQNQLGSTQLHQGIPFPNSAGQIPRPKDQPPQSVLPFQKPELLSFLDSPYNVWGTEALANFLPVACSDMRMGMPWTGTPLPTIEIKFEVPIEFSEAFMKFRQSRLNDRNIVQKVAHRNDSSDQVLG